MMLNAITFLRRGKVLHLTPTSPTRTVLEYLRLDEKSFGTKEGCNEGDCGACTVAIVRIKNNKLVYEPANACIMLVGQLHGCELVTVDDLALDGILHPVQAAMVKHHASQCGFCTPGFVMSLFTLYHSGIEPTRQNIVDHIAGNLCRCTGYRPIIDAAQDACQATPLDRWAENEAVTRQALQTLQAENDVMIPLPNGFLAIPTTANSLAKLAAENPDATIVSGATDVGLWVTKQLRVLPKIIHTFAVKHLHEISETASTLKIGTAATYAEAFDSLRLLHPDIAEVLRRLGSKHVRATGTMGGNIANGSPIGDSAPMLIALGTKLHLRFAASTRTIPIEDFFISYGKQDRKPGELVWQLEIPKLQPEEHFTAFKISKRFDQDISAVMFALKVKRRGTRLLNARLAFGGMAATPKRAQATEAALSAVDLNNEVTWPPALAALAKDFQPISDMRASAQYRIETAQSLLHKALLELSPQTPATRVLAKQESVA
jgi:xanthine dehydrogenase small subunit